MVCVHFFKHRNSSEIMKRKHLPSLVLGGANSLESVLPFLFMQLFTFKYIYSQDQNTYIHCSTSDCSCMTIFLSLYTADFPYCLMHSHYSFIWMHRILIYEPVQLFLVVSGLLLTLLLSVFYSYFKNLQPISCTSLYACTGIPRK